MEKFNQYYEISSLVLKYLRDELDTTESKKLEEWLQESDHNRKLFEKITSQDFINPELVQLSENNKDAAWQNIARATQQDNNVVYVKRNYRKIFNYAAIIAFVIISAVLMVYQLRQQNNNRTQYLAENDITPGGNKATLTLSDGTQILLEDVNNGELARQQSVVITKTADGQVIYQAMAQPNSSVREEFNTISTPKGGQYQLILPDGTKVWLNSMSSIKFPATFTGKERKIELTGEAYFEVSKNKEKPFIVQASDVAVKVLGTHFNITAYSDEPQIKTTLVEGSVKVSKGNSTRLLVPGMQAICSASEDIEVINTDIDEVVAWKNGYFLFRDEPIQNLMATISRWYNIEVNYEGNMEGKVFGGKFSKNNNLSELLKSLELTGTIKFKTEGRRVTVMP